MSDETGSRLEENAVGDGEAKNPSQGGLIYTGRRREIREGNLLIDWNLVRERELGDQF
jgi:hypothetical protein